MLHLHHHHHPLLLLLLLVPATMSWQRLGLVWLIAAGDSSQPGPSPPAAAVLLPLPPALPGPCCGAAGAPHGEGACPGRWACCACSLRVAAPAPSDTKGAAGHRAGRSTAVHIRGKEETTQQDAWHAPSKHAGSAHLHMSCPAGGEAGGNMWFGGRDGLACPACCGSNCCTAEPHCPPHSVPRAAGDHKLQTCPGWVMMVLLNMMQTAAITTCGECSNAHRACCEHTLTDPGTDCLPKM